jgi:hypothetical protein
VPCARNLAFSILLGLGLERLDEFGADDLAFFLRVGHAGQFLQKLFGPIHHVQVDMEMPAEHRLDALPLVLAKQAVIDKDADKLIADGLVQQRRRHRRIHPARQAADDGALPTWFCTLAMVSWTKSLICQSPAQPQIS